MRDRVLISESVLDRVVDELGLIPNNGFLVCYMPAPSKALVFRVISRHNPGAEVIQYGPLPLPAGTVLPTYDGTTASVPADGVIPSRALTPGLMFPIGLGTPLPFETTAYTNSDMWHLPAEEYRERLFHILMNVTPATLRCDLQIPSGVTQPRFQKDKVSLGIEYDWGFRRGGLETVQIPGVHYGWRFGNDLNISLHTLVRFTYGEYIVEIPKDAELIFNILNRRIPAHWVTLQIIGSYDATFSQNLMKNYGFDGFPLYGLHQRSTALETYNRLLGGAKI